MSNELVTGEPREALSHLGFRLFFQLFDELSSREARWFSTH